MVEDGVGVPLPDCLMFAALLPVGRLCLDSLLKGFLSFPVNLEFFIRQEPLRIRYRKIVEE
jgi:hypothetical protein